MTSISTRRSQPGKRPLMLAVGGALLAVAVTVSIVTGRAAPHERTAGADQAAESRSVAVLQQEPLGAAHEGMIVYVFDSPEVAAGLRPLVDAANSGRRGPAPAVLVVDESDAGRALLEAVLRDAGRDRSDGVPVVTVVDVRGTLAGTVCGLDTRTRAC